MASGWCFCVSISVSQILQIKSWPRQSEKISKPYEDSIYCKVIEVRRVYDYRNNVWKNGKPFYSRSKLSIRISQGSLRCKKVCFSVNSSAAKHAMPTKIRKDGQVPPGHLVIRPWCWPLRREGNIFFANTLKWEWVLRHICWRSFTWNFCLLKLDLRGMKGNLPPVIPEDGYWGLFHPITQITLAVRLFPFLIVWPACYKWLKEVQKAGPHGAEVTLNGEDSPKRSQRWT